MLGFESQPSLEMNTIKLRLGVKIRISTGRVEQGKHLINIMLLCVSAPNNLFWARKGH